MLFVRQENRTATARSQLLKKVLQSATPTNRDCGQDLRYLTVSDRPLLSVANVESKIHREVRLGTLLMEWYYDCSEA